MNEFDHVYQILEMARADERRNCAAVTASKLERIAARIQSEQLTPAEATGFIQIEIEKIQNEVFI